MQAQITISHAKTKSPVSNPPAQSKSLLMAGSLPHFFHRPLRRTRHRAWSAFQYRVASTPRNFDSQGCENKVLAARQTIRGAF